MGNFFGTTSPQSSPLHLNEKRQFEGSDVYSSKLTGIDYQSITTREFTDFSDHDSPTKSFDHIFTSKLRRSHNNLSLFLYYKKPSKNKLIDNKIMVYNNSSRESGFIKSAILNSTWIIIDTKNTRQNNTWYYITTTNTYGWINITSPITLEDTNIFQPKHSFRRYEIWYGKNYFLCFGYIMLGSDAPFFAATNFMIILPSIVYFIVLSRRSILEFSFMICLVLLLICCMYNFWMTAVTEPGIIPRNNQFLKIQPPLGNPNSFLGSKYCETCNIYRPPRSKHCTSCQNCVQEFDHHCPWTGNCVGKRNYKFFLRFISILTVYMFLILASSISIIIIDFTSLTAASTGGDNAYGPHVPLYQRCIQELKANPSLLLVSLVSITCTWSLVSLCAYHYYIVSIGQTTNENLRGIYRQCDNPFNRGCTSNCRYAWCAREDSLLHSMHDVILEDEFIEDNFHDARYEEGAET